MVILIAQPQFCLLIVKLLVLHTRLIALSALSPFRFLENSSYKKKAV